MVVTLIQSPDHVVTQGQTVIVDGDPYVVTAIKTDREAPCFLDWDAVIQPSRVTLTLERYDGNPA